VATCTRVAQYDRSLAFTEPDIHAWLHASPSLLLLLLAIASCCVPCPAMTECPAIRCTSDSRADDISERLNSLQPCLWLAAYWYVLLYNATAATPANNAADSPVQTPTPPTTKDCAPPGNAAGELDAALCVGLAGGYVVVGVPVKFCTVM
jgi:hypothetical protein